MEKNSEVYRRNNNEHKTLLGPGPKEPGGPLGARWGHYWGPGPNSTEFVCCQVRANETYSEAKHQFNIRNIDVLMKV